MASTYSTNLALELIGTGDQAGTWGNTTNTNLGTLIEQAISGYVTQAVATGTDTTITIPNGATGVARNMYIELTGTGGASTNLIVPSNKKLYFIFNNSTGAVTVKVSGQTGVSVAAGQKVVLVSNGTDVVNAVSYLSGASANITTLTATSANITTLTSTSANITTLTSTSLTVTNAAIASKFIPTGGTATGNGMYLSTTNTLGFSTNGTLRASMDASGNLLVGTTVAPGSNGAGIAIYKSDYPRLSFRNSTTGDANSDGTLMVMDGNDFTIANAEAGIISFQTQALERARITSTGDVGIGTSSPATKLEVSGTTRSSAFQTTSGTVSVPVSTATTFFTPSSSGLYLARIYLPGNASQTWDAVIIFTFNATNILVVNQTNSANVSTSISGTDVKVTQIGSGTFTFTYDVMRIG
jgi:hypothetical protein